MKYICIYIRNKKINMKICYTIKIDFDNPCENEQLCKPPRRGGGKKLSHYGDLEYIDNNDIQNINKYGFKDFIRSRFIKENGENAYFYMNTTSWERLRTIMYNTFMDFDKLNNIKNNINRFKVIEKYFTTNIEEIKISGYGNLIGDLWYEMNNLDNQDSFGDFRIDNENRFTYFNYFNEIFIKINSIISKDDYKIFETEIDYNSGCGFSDYAEKYMLLNRIHLIDAFIDTWSRSDWNKGNPGITKTFLDKIELNNKSWLVYETLFNWMIWNSSKVDRNSWNNARIDFINFAINWIKNEENNKKIDEEEINNENIIMY